MLTINIESRRISNSQDITFDKEQFSKKLQALVCTKKIVYRRCFSVNFGHLHDTLMVNFEYIYYSTEYIDQAFLSLTLTSILL